MVFQERLPGLGRRIAVTDHIFGDGRLRDLDPEPLQFTLYARRAPAYVISGHRPDKLAHFGIDSQKSQGN